MAKRKSKKRKGYSPKGEDQDQTPAVDNGEKTEKEALLDSLNGSVVDSATRDGQTQKRESKPGKSLKAAEKAPPTEPTSSPQEGDGHSASDNGGLIVVAIIFGLIGLAIASQILLN